MIRYFKEKIFSKIAFLFLIATLALVLSSYYVLNWEFIDKDSILDAHDAYLQYKLVASWDFPHNQDSMALELEKDVTIEDINDVMKEASNTYLKNLLQYSTEPIVSVDIIGNPYSGIYDAPLTRVVKNNFIKITGWYDNESGYANRIVDLARKIGRFKVEN